ncbi:PDZ domain-containing protein [Stratiformator vulcanicus]|uniref:Putative periplasmic serine endoprotease DegP-like n=1 Tax=Stratiformator vulcanicus TaxID=2527980 RepID=A0A517R2P7_9PLAN|nr:PDZ domain-containing protein [Stratiformator vulcanicus]QDT38134.1 putative periplasmic serine endoprotease DegP-like precursor [Stratiformator vulcanicus]
MWDYRRVLILPALAATLIAIAGSSDAEDVVELEEQAFKSAVAAVAPSLVRIRTVGGRDVVGGQVAGSGPTTGIVVSDDGYIVTSTFNFAAEPTSILVELVDGRQLAAKKIADDKSRMLTLLKVDAENLIPAEPAEISEVKVGQWAIGVGRAYRGSRPNLAIGIISAKDRIYGKAVQTDAKVSPVNYGGPLIDISGRVVGILVPLSMQGKGTTAGVEYYDSGIGFAVPFEDFLSTTDRLKAGETLRPGLLGISFKSKNELTGEPLIGMVRVDSPAEQIGLATEDTLISINGKPVQRIADVKQAIGPLYAGDTIEVGFRRGDETLSGSAELVAELKPYASGFLGILPARPDGSENAAAVTDDETTGMRVRYVFKGSPAEEAGLSVGDVITAVKFKNAEASGEESNDAPDWSPVTSSEELLGVIRNLRPGQEIELEYEKGDSPSTVTVALDSVPTEIVGSLPIAAIVPPGEDVEVDTGRLSETWEDGERSYWAYVPESYNPQAAYGLIVWLHPAGDTMEAEVSRKWKPFCDLHGVCLLGPKAADIAGWKGEEIEYVTELTRRFRERYSIDPVRVAVVGRGRGGVMAFQALSKERDLYTGAAIIDSPIAGDVIQNDPNYRTQFLFAFDESIRILPLIKRSAQLLNGLKFPVASIPYTSEDGRLPRTSIEALFRWFDALDRI